MQITLGGVVSTFQKLKDRSYKIVLESGELSPNQLLGLDQLYQQAVYVIIGENPIETLPDDLPIALEQGAEKQARKKSPSQRLRGILYRYREQSEQKQHPKFQTYYELMMEKFIMHYQEKLL